MNEITTSKHFSTVSSTKLEDYFSSLTLRCIDNKIAIERIKRIVFSHDIEDVFLNFLSSELCDDYRYLADLIRLKQSGIPYNRAGKMTKRELDSLRYSLSPAHKSGVKSEFVQLDDLRKCSGKSCNSIHLLDPSYEGFFLELHDDCNGSINEYFSSKLDLLGIRRLVRINLVKSTTASDGREFIIKSNNPGKAGRFWIELESIKKFDSIGISSNEINLHMSDRKIGVRLLNYAGIISTISNTRLFSVSEKISLPTLEEFFICEQDYSKRAVILEEVSSILEWLYSKGVWWGDMAPRNILVDLSGDYNNYILLDFEKTKFFQAPICEEDRIKHSRGAMCIEEFGAVCSLEEVKFCFGNYFKPDEWNLISRENIDFVAKPDYIQILSSRGNNSPGIGDYNSLELEIMDVRFPYVDSKSRLSYPLSIGFRIDHYVGADLDRKTTEVLLHAKKLSLFELISDSLQHILDVLDADLLESEFISICDGITFTPHVLEFNSTKLLIESIDYLYNSIGRDSEFSIRIHNLKNILISW